MILKVTLVQLSAGPGKAENLAHACALVEESASLGAGFVLLPEVFTFVADASMWRTAAETIPGPITDRLSELARRRGIWILAGSLLEVLPGEDRCANTSTLINPRGEIAARYSKMHLFSVKLPDGGVFDEIDHTRPGERLVVAETDFGRVGMTICYDVRFPELFRALTLRGATFITVPSAFTAFTGQAHWKVLLRARAIENQVFVLAPNQVGSSATGVCFHGHSMVVDPWGTVVAEAGEAEELLTVELDTARVAEVRNRLASLQHVRADVLDELARSKREKD